MRQGDLRLFPSQQHGRNAQNAMPFRRVACSHLKASNARVNFCLIETQALARLPGRFCPARRASAGLFGSAFSPPKKLSLPAP
jgi:hypothetical protein